MNNTYIAADLQLWDREIAKKLNLTIQKYNQMIIDRINATAAQDDYLILFGDISKGNFEQTKEYLSQLKAEWTVVDLQDQPLFRTSDFWQKMGARKGMSLDGFVKGEVNGDEVNIIISTNSSNVQLWLGENNYIAMAESAAIKENLLKEGEIYRNKILNISLFAWDFYPININDIPRTINDEILFAEMEEL